MTAPDRTRPATRLIHAGEPQPRIGGAVAMPVFQTAMFMLDGERGYHDLRYIRLNNTPNHIAVQGKLAALEGAEAALVTASGMAAITTSLLTELLPGGHLLAQRCLYGGTLDFVTKGFAELGLTYDFIDGNDPDSWERLLRPNTKAIYVEAMTNPLLQVADLTAVADFASAHGLVSMIDNTFATPLNFRPIERGFDLSLHSCTKYLNGHSDLVAGAVVGSAERVESIRKRLNELGGSLDPHACVLLHRGMKTLAVRMRQHEENALQLARFLEQHPAVERVHYPGLQSHPQHALARELFDGFSGMLSFEPKGGVEVANAVLSRTRVALNTVSLGGVETLVTRPALSSHKLLSERERREAGIAEGLVRVSVGIEDIDDLVADFDQALPT
jgi:cystathionine beta-lyase/cystathionine gamma-synthase